MPLGAGGDKGTVTMNGVSLGKRYCALAYRLQSPKAQPLAHESTPLGRWRQDGHYNSHAKLHSKPGLHKTFLLKKLKKDKMNDVLTG